MQASFFFLLTGDTGMNEAYGCHQGGQRGFAANVDGAKKNNKKRFGEERMNLLLCGEAYKCKEEEGGGVGGGCKREKSDRLDYESTHRRTLFNVSLTFLFPISSSPRRPSLTVAMVREEKLAKGGRESLEEGKALPLLHPRSQAADKDKGQGSCKGQLISK